MTISRYDKRPRVVYRVDDFIGKSGVIDPAADGNVHGWFGIFDTLAQTGRYILNAVEIDYAGEGLTDGEYTFDSTDDANFGSAAIGYRVEGGTITSAWVKHRGNGDSIYTTTISSLEVIPEAASVHAYFRQASSPYDYALAAGIPITWAVVPNDINGGDKPGQTPAGPTNDVQVGRGSWRDLVDYMAACGGEVASHSYYHANIAAAAAVTGQTAATQAAWEMIESKAAINAGLIAAGATAGVDHCKTFIQPGAWTDSPHAMIDGFDDLLSARGSVLKANYDQSMAYIGSGVGITTGAGIHPDLRHGLFYSDVLDYGHASSNNWTTTTIAQKIADVTNLTGGLYVIYGHGCCKASGGAWAGTTAYAIGDVRTNGGYTYICLEAHTSGTFATDLAAGKWVLADYHSPADIWKAFIDALVAQRDAGKIVLCSFADACNQQLDERANRFPDPKFGAIRAAATHRTQLWSKYTDAAGRNIVAAATVKGMPSLAMTWGYIGTFNVDGTPGGSSGAYTLTFRATPVTPATGANVTESFTPYQAATGAVGTTYAGYAICRPNGSTFRNVTGYDTGTGVFTYDGTSAGFADGDVVCIVGVPPSTSDLNGSLTPIWLEPGNYTYEFYLRYGNIAVGMGRTAGITFTTSANIVPGVYSIEGVDKVAYAGAVDTTGFPVHTWQKIVIPFEVIGTPQRISFRYTHGTGNGYNTFWLAKPEIRKVVASGTRRAYPGTRRAR